MLYLAAICLLFSLIGFIPDPLHEYAEDLCVRVLGQVDSRFLIYGNLVFVLLIQVPILGALAIAIRLRPPKDGQRYERLEILRKRLLAEGRTPQELGIWTAADWYRCFRLMGAGCALITCLAFAALYGIGKWSPVHTLPVRDVSLDAPELGFLDRAPVRIHATARLNLAFDTTEGSYGAGILSGTRIYIFRLGRYGFQPASSVLHRNTLFVPMTGPAWRPGQPVEVFYKCDVLCVFTVPEGSVLAPKDIVAGGRLHRSALPLFVKRTFERAGIAVASPYYVLTDSEEDPLKRALLTAVFGFLSAGFIFALFALYARAYMNQSKLGQGV